MQGWVGGWVGKERGLSECQPIPSPPNLHESHPQEKDICCDDHHLPSFVILSILVIMCGEKPKNPEVLESSVN